MVSIKTPQEIAIMRQGGRMLVKVFRALQKAARPGVTTKELDELARSLVFSFGARPAFLGYRPRGESKAFPASLCVSINDEVVHGIPGSRALAEGDIVGLDFGILHEGYYTDGALTLGMGKISREASRLLRVTEEALYLGINEAKVGNRIGDIGAAVQAYVEKNDFAVIRQLVGHGIGKELHEPPQIANFGTRNTGDVIQEGMVIAIEPMVAAGDWKLKLSEDSWTYKTADGSLSAHFEHTVAVTKRGPRILTK